MVTRETWKDGLVSKEMKRTCVFLDVPALIMLAKFASLKVINAGLELLTAHSLALIVGAEARHLRTMA
jgi:hypothetical protein